MRDELVARLEQLDADRAELVRRLSEIDPEPSLAEGSPRRSTSSVANARVRWLGAS